MANLYNTFDEINTAISGVDALLEYTGDNVNFATGTNKNYFGVSSSTNVFGDFNSGNSFGNNSTYNSFGTSTAVNDFGKTSLTNYFGEGANNNYFGDEVSLNYFQGDVYLSADNIDTYLPNSALSQQTLMKGGFKFRQMVVVNGQSFGADSATTGGIYNILGMRARVGAAANQSAGCYTFDNLRTHGDTSSSTMAMRSYMDFYFHGVGLQFQSDSNWVGRINIGVGSPTRNPPPVGQYTSSECWGIQFYSTNDTYFKGRMFYNFDGVETLGDEFDLPIYPVAGLGGWAGYVYSIRMRQVLVSANRLELEFYINDSVSNSGGEKIPSTPTAAMTTTTFPAIPRYGGQHVNFEVVTDVLNAPNSTVRMQCSNMYCEYKTY